MALPGTPGQRISDLCNGNHITQKQLAKKIGVSASQLSRIVSGETKTVSSDILKGVAKEFKVSTDYILGLSTLSVRKRDTPAGETPQGAGLRDKMSRSSGSVPTPEHAAGMGQEAFSGRAAKRKMEGTHER